MVATLTGYKLFRHTSDISAQSYAWCDANATLLYSGTGLSFADTGLASDTVYYYKLFSAYNVDGATYYSEGISTSETTQTNSVSDYQPWENYPDSPVLTEDYPYQVVFDYAGGKRLWVTTEPFSLYSANELRIKTFGATPNIYYILNAGGWLLIGAYNVQTFTTLEETNNDIYTDTTLSSVYFAKTT